MRSLLLLVTSAVVAWAQAENNPQHAIDLAMKGQCTDAMPLLDQAMRDSATAKETKRAVSFAGVRCSMLSNQQMDAMSFLGWLQQEIGRASCRERV